MLPRGQREIAHRSHAVPALSQARSRRLDAAAAVRARLRQLSRALSVRVHRADREPGDAGGAAEGAAGVRLRAHRARRGHRWTRERAARTAERRGRLQALAGQRAGRRVRRAVRAAFPARSGRARRAGARRSHRERQRFPALRRRARRQQPDGRAADRIRDLPAHAAGTADVDRDRRRSQAAGGTLSRPVGTGPHCRVAGRRARSHAPGSRRRPADRSHAVRCSARPATPTTIR